MATRKRPPAAPRDGGITPTLLEKALLALMDPKVQILIVEHASSVIDAVKHWGTAAADHVEQVGDRFGQKGLERRAASLREVVATLSGDSPAIAATLRPVTDSLKEVGQLLIISESLPLVKRKKAHRRIDDILDKLESGLSDAIPRGGSSDRDT